MVECSGFLGLSKGVFPRQHFHPELGGIGVGIRGILDTPWSYLNALALDQLEESNQRVLVHGQP